MNFYSIEEYEFQVRELEEEGLCRSYAQAVVDAREMRDAREYAEFRREEDLSHAQDAQFEFERGMDDSEYENQYDFND